MQMFAKLLQCDRRKQNLAPTVSNGDATSSMEKRKSKRRGDVWKGSEPADVSTDDVSDHSETRAVDGSVDSDSSDAAPDFPSARTGSSFRPCRTGPIAPPPGLEPPQAQAPPQVCNRSSLQEVGIDMTPEAEQEQKMRQPGPGNDSNLLALKEALDRLHPAEIATVRSLLDSKMCGAGMTQHPNEQSYQVAARANAAQHPWRVQPSTDAGVDFQGFQKRDAGAVRVHRPFTPFQGSRPPVGRIRQPAARHSAFLKHSKPEQGPDGGTLKTFLNDLALVEDERVLCLRKINHLGLDSATLLETHFSKFGKVARIMVQHSKEKGRVRPATLGFAVMSNAEEAKAAFDQGKTHIVAGMEIAVLPFSSHPI